MKIGLDIKPFNSIMRFRRQEMKLTQAELSRMAGVSIKFIGRVETLKMPISGKIDGESRAAKRSKLKRFRLIRDKLNRVAQALELDFDYLFPQDYLDAIEQELLPWYKLPIIWVREIDISNLAILDMNHPALLLPSAEEIVFDKNNGLPEKISEILSDLSEVEATVIDLRFLSDEPLTFEEIGCQFGITGLRVRQIEAKALRKLRHPIRSRRLRDYLK